MVSVSLISLKVGYVLDFSPKNKKRFEFFGLVHVLDYSVNCFSSGDPFVIRFPLLQH